MMMMMIMNDDNDDSTNDSINDDSIIPSLISTVLPLILIDKYRSKRYKNNNITTHSSNTSKLLNISNYYQATIRSQAKPSV